jgi:EF-P beta-lysylation protein EpmB
MNIVPLSPLPQIVSWRHLLLQNFTRWEKLADFLQLNNAQKEEILTLPKFSLNLPLRLAEKIKKGTLEDPILKQFLPMQEERNVPEGFKEDPVGDKESRKEKKLLKKYSGRALLLCTSACAMHCRYCFRQHFDYATHPMYEAEIAEIAADSSLEEILLSGGDPLTLSDKTLQELLKSLEAISHVKRVRFHTRFPIGIPERIDLNFLHLLKSFSKQIWFVIHVNHPAELDEDVLESLRAVQKLGIPVLNQSVLLRGVNDRLDVLKKLSECLIDHGILPYYLHQLDKVQGAAHFEVDELEGCRLVQEMTKVLPGYGVPQYVREIAGELSKTPIGTRCHTQTL